MDRAEPPVDGQHLVVLQKLARAAATGSASAGSEARGRDRGISRCGCTAPPRPGRRDGPHLCHRVSDHLLLVEEPSRRPLGGDHHTAITGHACSYGPRIAASARFSVSPPGRRAGLVRDKGQRPQLRSRCATRRPPRPATMSTGFSSPRRVNRTTRPSAANTTSATKSSPPPTDSKRMRRLPSGRACSYVCSAAARAARPGQGRRSRP